jgi:LCP family protein required for cell wall assembly
MQIAPPSNLAAGPGGHFLATVEPPFDGGYQDEPYAYFRRGINTRLIVAIGAFAVLSLWASLAVFTRVDAVLFPGNELGLGIPLVGIDVPGIKPENDQASAEVPEDRINILFLGLDQRFDEADDQPYRTDSVMVLTIDPFSKTAGSFSIPRDTLVDINTDDGNYWTRTRVNEVYEMGEYPDVGFPDACKGCGAQLAMDTIEENFGIPINFYVIMNWENFTQIVDDLDGIDVNVPEYAYDPAYSTCQFCGNYYGIEFLPGPETMDGQRALEYARIRASDNDYKRVERQQLVLRAIIAKAKTLNFVNVGKMKDLYGTYHDSVRTNIPDTSIPGLGLLVKQIDEKGGLANMKMVSMADATYPCPAVQCGNAAALEWNVRKMEALKAQVFSNVQLSTESAVITILNGTNASLFATEFKDELTVNGIPPYNVTADEIANGLIYPTTVIVNIAGGNPSTMRQLQQLLAIPDSQVLTATDPAAAQFLNTDADIVVVLGTDSAPTPGSNYIPPDDTYVPPEDTYVPPESEEVTPTPDEGEPTETPAEEEPTPEPEATETPQAGE